MVEFGKRLCSSAHYEQKDITTRQRAVLQRREKVKQNAVTRRNRLDDCRKLMVFMQNCMEVSNATEYGKFWNSPLNKGARGEWRGRA